MPVELAFVCSDHNGHDKWNVHRSQDDVRNQDGEVNGARPVVVRVGDRSNVDVVDHVGRQEEYAGHECSRHHALVSFPITRPNAKVSKDKEDDADAIECGV